MPTTTNLGLHYPASSDPPNGPLQLGQLANDFDAFWGPWTPWTCTVTQSTSVTITAQDCAYRLVGKQVHLRVFVLCSTGGTGANKVVVGGVPAAVAPVASGMIAGYGRIYDVSAVTPYRGTVEFDVGSTTNLVLELAAGLAGAATFTAALNTNDLISYVCRYPKS